MTDIEVASSAIFEVTSGPSTGYAWLVDTFLPNMKILKFSGTNEVGSNSRLVGKTCDALAHFSLVSSGGSMVLVDIQGE